MNEFRTAPGFKFSDTKILLGSRAHGDHPEGDAMVKGLTGAKVMAMAEDVPALEVVPRRLLAGLRSSKKGPTVKMSSLAAVPRGF